MMKTHLLLLLLLCLPLPVTSQQTGECYPFASAQQRNILQSKLNDSIISPMAVSHLLSDLGVNWSSYAWATAYIQDTSRQNYRVLDKALSNYKMHSKEDLQQILQTVYSCFPTQFASQIFNIAENENSNSKIIATVLSYLKNNNQDVDQMLRSKTTHTQCPILTALNNQYTKKHNPVPVDQLEILFRYNRDKGYKILYSLQFSDRDNTGIALIQNKDGHFAIQGNHLFTVDQLARSITNMPSYITNGNTPVGVYRIENLRVSDNKFIGPTPSFVAYLPFETTPGCFFDNQASAYTLQAYLEMLPPCWRDNTIFEQAYWAGKAGRGQIHFHGTTIDPQLYINKPFYPQTPSMGCLCTCEVWDPDGYILHSDQQKLTDIWQSTPGESGYAYVIETEYMPRQELIERINKIISNIEK